MQIRNITPLAFAVALTFACSAHATQAPDATATGNSGKPLSVQQLRMKNCNADAKAQALKGDERRAFMSTCLKGTSTALAAHDADKTATPDPARSKRKACGATAKEKGLKGDDRKAFVRECVSDGKVADAG